MTPYGYAGYPVLVVLVQDVVRRATPHPRRTSGAMTHSTKCRLITCIVMTLWLWQQQKQRLGNPLSAQGAIPHQWAPGPRETRPNCYCGAPRGPSQGGRQEQAKPEDEGLHRGEKNPRKQGKGVRGPGATSYRRQLSITGTVELLRFFPSTYPD